MIQFTLEETKALIDEETLAKLVNRGEPMPLTEDEKMAISTHHRGDQRHLLTENWVIHKNGLIVTKFIDGTTNIPKFVREILNCCAFSKRVYFGKSYS